MRAESAVLLVGPAAAVAARDGKPGAAAAPAVAGAACAHHSARLRAAVRVGGQLAQRPAASGFPPRYPATHPSARRLVVLENNELLGLDARSAGRAYAGYYRRTDEGFEDGSWGKALCAVTSLRKFVLELETLQSKRAELDEIVQAATGWEFPLADGSARLVCDEAAKEVSKWKGIDRFYELQNDWRGALAPAAPDEGTPAPPTLDYHVVKLTWRRRAMETSQKPPNGVCCVSRRIKEGRPESFYLSHYLIPSASSGSV